MKRFWGIVLTVSLLFSHTEAFRDVPSNSPLTPAVNDLLHRGVLEDGAFLRLDDTVSAQMFWEVVLRDAGFDPESATFDTPVPPNVRADAPIAQFLREAIRRGFIDAYESFDFEKEITRAEAIKIIVITKGILLPQGPSAVFKRRVAGAPKYSDGLRYIEAAYASKILDDSDLETPFFTDDDLLLRRDLIRWLYNFSDHGEKKSSVSLQNSLRKTLRRSQSDSSENSNSSTVNTPTRTIGGQRNVIQIKSVNSPSSSISREITELNIPNGRILEAVYQAIQSKFRFPERLGREKNEAMIESAIAGMVKALEDKYSVYIESTKSEEFKEGLEGKFDGIGAYVEMVDNKFTITAPIKGSPAEDAGLIAGDIVTHVDGESLDDKPVNDIIEMIRGESGTIVVLTILRNGIPQDVQVTRGKITVPSVTIEWKKSIPIIGIHRFANNTTEAEFKKILLEEVLPKNPRGIILDLRNNPGGFLNSAVIMTEFLLDKDELVFTVDYTNAKQEYRSSRRGELYGYKNVVILVNKGSASASEIFAAAAQDYGRAVILGKKSHGKGTVQEIISYPGAGSLKLTVAKWLTPHGHWIQEGPNDEDHGVIPDIEVEDQTTEQRRANIDPMVDRAVNEVLNH